MLEIGKSIGKGNNLPLASLISLQTEIKSQGLGMAGAGMGSITYGVAVIFCPLYIILSNSIKDSVNKKL